MSFSCVPSLGKVFPKKSMSTSSSSVNESDDGMNKKEEEKQKQQEKQQEKEKQVAKKDEGKQKSNLDRAASATPYFPFHSRPGLL